LIEAIKKECADKNVESALVDAKEDSSKQIDQVESFVTKGMDVIVVIPVDTSAVAEITQKVSDTSGKLIYLNRYPNPLPDETYYVGSKESQAGEIQGQFLKDKIKPGDKVAILMGRLGEEATNKRTESVEKAITDLGGIVVDKQTGNWMRPEGLRITEDWIQKYGTDLKAICSNNDDMALGALEALSASNMLENCSVYGIDATPDALEYIKTGKLSGTVFQDAVGQGVSVVDLAVDLVQGNSREKELWIPFEAVDKENVEEYIEKY